MRVSDKQQELDIPSLRLDENQQDEGRPSGSSTGKSGSSAGGGASTSSQSSSSGQSKKKDVKSKVTPMSHISGVKRALSHANSFTGERLPKYGVDTLKEDELGQVSDSWNKVGVQLETSCFHLMPAGIIANTFPGTS